MRQMMSVSTENNIDYKSWRDTIRNWETHMETWKFAGIPHFNPE